jgi:dienelactone hydrolase
MRPALAGAIVAVVLSLLLTPPGRTAGKAALLVSEQFPHIPVKPLRWMSSPPTVEQVELDAGQPILADVVIPDQRGKHPVIILAMGVRTLDEDRPVLLGLADTLARLGYLTMWPRSRAIEAREIFLEDPEVFVRSVLYVLERPDVEPRRISLVGFSIGASIALVAAADPRIAAHVHALIFFGGYYRLVDYLTALATFEVVVEGRRMPWTPHDWAVDLAEQALQHHGLSLEDVRHAAWTSQLPPEVVQSLQRVSPDAHLQRLQAKVFILHDVSDAAVPWVESQKLQQALDPALLGAYHISNIFEHVQFRRRFDPAMVAEVLMLSTFLYRVLDFV